MALCLAHCGTVASGPLGIDGTGGTVGGLKKLFTRRGSGIPAGGLLSICCNIGVLPKPGGTGGRGLAEAVVQSVHLSLIQLLVFQVSVFHGCVELSHVVPSSTVRSWIAPTWLEDAALEDSATVAAAAAPSDHGSEPVITHGSVESRVGDTSVPAIDSVSIVALSTSTSIFSLTIRDSVASVLLDTARISSNGPAV
jgi:hypothetical protein